MEITTEKKKGVRLKRSFCLKAKASQKRLETIKTMHDIIIIEREVRKMLVTVTGLQKVTKVIEIENGKKLEGNTNFYEIEKYLYEVSPEVREFYEILAINLTQRNKKS